MHLWEHVDIENQKTWTAFHPSLFRTSTHFYGSFIRDVLISEVTLELNQWITFMDELVGLQILSLEKIAIRRDTVGGPANRTQPILLCLKNVSLSDCSREIMHAIILLFQRAQRLKRLCITGCDFNEGDLCTIATMCPRLADFTLGVDEEHGSGGDAFASTLALSCPKIQSLDLIGLSLQTGLGSLIKAYGSRLKKLHLKKMSQISAADLMLIAEYCKGSTLNKLTLSRLPLLTDRVLDRILRATGASIEFLQLDSLPITDAGLAAVTRNCTNLTQLRMYDLRELQDLSFLNSKWPRLKQIILHGSPDIAEVESLDNLGAPLLERLELVGCLSVPQDSLRRMLFHFTNLSRFVYVGAHATGDFQKV